MSDRDPRTIFITGSSSGLGRATAKLFSSRGWKVIATMRNPEKEASSRSSGTSCCSRWTSPTRNRSSVRRQSGGRWRSRCRLQQRRLRDVGTAGRPDRRTDAPDGQHQPDGADPHHEGIHPPFQREEGGAVHQHDLNRRIDHRPIQLAVPRHEVGARGLEREHGFRTGPAWHRHEDRGAGRNEDRLLHALVRCRPTSGYDALVDKVMGAITDPKQMETYSTPEQIAEVVYEAATDGKDQLRYVAGADAKATYATRLQLGDEAFRKASGSNSSGGRRGNSRHLRHRPSRTCSASSDSGSGTDYDRLLDCRQHPGPAVCSGSPALQLG